MSWGRANRLSRIINPTTGRTNMLAVDHGYFLGPTRGLEQPRERLAPLLAHADALMATRGLIRAGMPASMPCSVVLRVSGGSSAFDAVAAGAAGIDFGRNCWQSEHPVAMIRALRGIVHEGLEVSEALSLYRDLVGSPIAEPVRTR
jgi:DhnA family fructose-bisphosphate aldolase class Ia